VQGKLNSSLGQIGKRKPKVQYNKSNAAMSKSLLYDLVRTKEALSVRNLEQGCKALSPDSMNGKPPKSRKKTASQSLAKPALVLQQPQYY